MTNSLFVRSFNRCSLSLNTNSCLYVCPYNFIVLLYYVPLKSRNYVYMLYYSLLSATIGESLDAFHAGYMPAIRLSPTDIPQTVARSVGRNTGDILPKLLLGPSSPPGPPPEPNPAINR